MTVVVTEKPQDAVDFFNATFDAIPTTVTYDPKWANNTGYHDGMFKGDNKIIVEDADYDEGQIINLVIKPGQAVKGIDPMDRKFIILGTLLGGVVVFERYSPEEPRKEFRFQADDRFTGLHLLPSSGILGRQGMGDIFGEKMGYDLSERVALIFARIKGEA